ncbi:MAG TPA: arginine--tRNA ligase [Phycisphaerae bacterium]|mgnify:CR=1 FL=1|nr:arginine--tRNA ligase [Phycisphaerae bacterium]HPP25393.1 arginine--tRNA ligase [Phycisphaerae bacterium]
MTSIAGLLERLFTESLVAIMGEDGRGVDPLIRPATDVRFGDYQSNIAMSLAKRLGAKPRDLAQKIIDHLPADAQRVCEPFEIAGPGFINIRLAPAWMAEQLNLVPAASPGTLDRLGIEKVAAPKRVVVDYSGPNIAKQMHVGHLRSSIIGDTIARVLDFEGHQVIRQNHIGDWGTQFGMLCAYLKEKMPAALDQPDQVHLSDLEAFYREASARDKDDADFHERARAEVVALHNKNESTLRAWRYIVDESRRHYLPVYRRLGVLLTQEDERGESFYADRLPQVVGDFEQAGVITAPPGLFPGGAVLRVEVSQGALVIFFENAAGEPLFKSPEGKPLPMIIRKSDGAFLYATTDLAALQFRIKELGAERVIYVTDARQAQHFEMVFTAARAAGWTVRSEGTASSEVQLDHVTFGTILGEDRRPLKTRSGENVKLADLLDEAVRRAEALVRATEADPDKRRGFSDEEIRDVAEAVGIGAVKYADLSQNRQSDYVFSWDRMLALEGNTAPYLMYAYARIRSIYRKGAETQEGELNATQAPIQLTEPAERALGRQILRFAETIESVAAGLRINLLTDYLYELAGLFMKFYEHCPVLRAETPELKASRLRLCDLTARTLQVGLGLLGIRTLERM